jgi:hypothetical protein
MNLFAPDRPEASPGHKAILRDGSAIPHFVLRLEESGLVQLSAMLRNYDDNSYSYRYAELPQDVLPEFLALFRANPEQALEDYFNWHAQPPTAALKLKVYSGSTSSEFAQQEAKRYANDLL